MRVHPSNYRIEGFTAAVPDSELAGIAREAGLPFVSDLGSGSLLDLSRFGLPREPTARETIAAGADLVSFSGDKLLGGPQAGIIVGRRALVDRIRRNPLKRALRCDKMTIAALEAVLRLYDDPDRAQRASPTLRLIARPAAEIAALAERLAPVLVAALDGLAPVEVAPCRSQVGSGALPSALLASMGLRIGGRRRKGALSARQIAEALRKLPMPVIGRAVGGAVVLDLRCLEDEALFVANLQSLAAALRETGSASP
jgi:L-seryl-tRNA(Ser) seleniumtransferase